MKSTFFDSALGRLKAALGATEDQEVAHALGMTKAAFSARKKREAFPEKEVYALAAKHPELNLDLAYVLTGKTQRETLIEAAAKATSLSPAQAKEVGVPRTQTTALPPSNTRTQALIDAWKACTPEDQAAIEQIVNGLAEKAALNRR